MEDPATTFAQYSDGDQVTLTGVLREESYDYEGSPASQFVLVLDEPIDCNVAHYSYSGTSDGNLVWHEAVGCVSVGTFDESVGSLVDQHVSVSGTLRGPDDVTGTYDSSGTFHYGGGDAIIDYATVRAA